MSSVATAHRTGVATYIVELATHIAAADFATVYYLCYRLSRMKRRAHFLTVNSNNFRTRVFQEPFTPFLRRKLDVFHGPDERLPQFTGVPLVATMFDLAPFVTTEFYPEKFREKKRRRYQDIAERATRIITLSENTKQEIVEHLHVPPGRITRIYPGVNSTYKPRTYDECLSVRAKYGIETDYLVCVASISRKKNTARVLEAFARLPDSLLKDTIMVLAGPTGYGGEEVRNRISALPIEKKVVLTGYVPKEDLPVIVAGARAAVFVTLYEGFGLPVVEAMASDVPVIVSNVSSLPEVAAGAALVVDPYDTAEITAAMERVLTDDDLRDRLIRVGRERAREFTWDKTATATVRLYREVALSH